MSHKVCLFLIIVLLAALVYLLWENNVNHNSYIDLSNSFNDQNKSYTALLDAKRAALFDQGLLLPKGLDQHYERIRIYESQRFTNKGDSGWLVFYVTQVLHDLGDYNYTQCYAEFINDTSIPCRNLTIQFASNFIKYVDESTAFMSIFNSNVTELQMLYEWVNDFVNYTNDTDGFARFPVETLTCRFGDC